MATRDIRRGENQKIFQHDEWLHDATVAAGYETAPVPFLCECADENCLGRVELTPSQWEVVSAAPNHYVMIAGHPRNEADMDSLVRGVDKAETGTNGDLGLADVLSGGNGNGLEVA